MRHDESLKKQIEIYYKTHDLTPMQLSRRFNIPYTTIKDWIYKEKWQKASAIENIDVTKEDVVVKNFDIVTNTTKNRIKDEIEHNLGETSYNIDRVILDSLLNEASEALLLQAMSLNHINKTLAMNAMIAKGALLDLQRHANTDNQKLAIIASTEKVNKIFLDLKESLYGKDIKLSNAHTINYDEMTDAEILEIINKESSTLDSQPISHESNESNDESNLDSNTQSNPDSF